MIVVLTAALRDGACDVALSAALCVKALDYSRYSFYDGPKMKGFTA
jgi:hypothetical protein